MFPGGAQAVTAVRLTPAIVLVVCPIQASMLSTSVEELNGAIPHIASASMLSIEAAPICICAIIMSIGPPRLSRMSVMASVMVW